VSNENRVVGLLAALCLAGTAYADIADCQGIQDVKSAKELNSSTPLMVSLNKPEKQGEANFRPDYEPPVTSCVREKFDVTGVPVSVEYSPFTKSENDTLHYRVRAGGGDGAREILVIYDGLASLVAKKGFVFFVIENRKGSISYYSMFRGQPAYADLKPVFVSILDGSAKPLATVHWPAGEKEPVIDAFDSKRLK
jgi:hypothetical protein